MIDRAATPTSTNVSVCCLLPHTICESDEKSRFAGKQSGSIINLNHQTHIGEPCLEHGGGGHRNAGTCQVDNDQAVDVLAQLTQRINADG
ncbi:hypothetical protein [Bacterioplanoides sp.]|uniref:hypothetical protein n=1 Tax=Bacterioplanoides sp. TaxID=2066072 RepID=UPI003B00B426